MRSGQTRVVSMDDAKPLAANREFLAPWVPARDDSYYTDEAQRTILGNELDAYERQTMVPLAIVDSDGQLNENFENLAGAATP
jgi:[ribosomal protein S5]-alanine N-acetyltransferase